MRLGTSLGTTDRKKTCTLALIFFASGGATALALWTEAKSTVGIASLLYIGTKTIICYQIGKVVYDFVERPYG